VAVTGEALGALVVSTGEAIGALGLLSSPGEVGALVGTPLVGVEMGAMDGGPVPSPSSTEQSRGGLTCRAIAI
jgi:hypothetical protein